MNSVTLRPLRVRYETRIRLLQVPRTERLTPRMRRSVPGGDALEGFNAVAPDDHVKLFFPTPGQDKPTLPVMGSSSRALPDDAARPVARGRSTRIVSGFA